MRAAASCLRRLKEEELMKRIDEVIVKTIIAAEPALGKCRLPARLPARPPACPPACPPAPELEVPVSVECMMLARADPTNVFEVWGFDIMITDDVRIARRKSSLRRAASSAQAHTGVLPGWTDRAKCG